MSRGGALCSFSNLLRAMSFLPRSAIVVPSYRQSHFSWERGSTPRSNTDSDIRVIVACAARCDVACEPLTARIDPGELGAQQEDLRRAIDPHEQHDDGTRRAEARGDAALADIEPDQDLADLEQHGGHDGADPHVAPRDGYARHQLVDHREQAGRKRNGDDQVERLQQRLPTLEHLAEPRAERGNARAQDQRDQRQEAQAKN